MDSSQRPPPSSQRHAAHRRDMFLLAQFSVNAQRIWATPPARLECQRRQLSNPTETRFEPSFKSVSLLASYCRL